MPGTVAAKLRLVTTDAHWKLQMSVEEERREQGVRRRRRRQ